MLFSSLYKVMEGQVWWADKFSLKDFLFFSFTPVICKDKGMNEFMWFGDKW